ncbi:MAG: esterase-like activity of phytase family protein, partial [Lysobacterales bacterium]
EDENDGLIPQAPSGALLIVDLRNAAENWKIMEADLSPVAAAAHAGEDLEAEYVDINGQNEAVMSFQENNHLAIVDLVTGETLHQFPAGSVELEQVDTNENGLIELAGNIEKRREPDAVAWLDHDSFATANEGDYEDDEGIEGGSRGFTIFNQDGSVEYESAAAFEHWLASAGHYNEDRSENKGCEPEAVDVGQYGGRTLLFVGSERCNAVGVYDVSTGLPEPLQVLPTGIRPEGLKAMADRNLFAASTEADEAGVGIPTMINLYRAEVGPALYPMIASGDDGSGADLPITWVALSGLAGDPADAGTLYAVSDAFLAEGFIYTIDASGHPAMITGKLQVTGASADLDLEGIAVGPDGHFWLGSEGNASSKPNLVLKVDSATGAVIDEFSLPNDLVDQRRANGIEGVAVTGAAGSEVVYVAIQRAWPNEGDTDEVNTKIGRYEVATGEWTFVHYPLQPEGAGDWIGLSELTLLPDGSFAVVERDKGWGPTTGFNAELKAVYGVELATADFLPYQNGVANGGLVTLSKTLLRDLLPDMAAVSIWTAEKLEGLPVGEATGETLFLGLGDWQEAFTD